MTALLRNGGCRVQQRRKLADGFSGEENGFGDETKRVKDWKAIYSPQEFNKLNRCSVFYHL